MVKCLLCGCSYQPGASHCPGCPMSRACKTTCCPNCGYTLPAESTLVKWWRRLSGKLEKEKSQKAKA